MSKEEINLECKLLCASAAAAGITTGGIYNSHKIPEKNRKQFKSVGYIGDVFSVVGGVEEIEAVLVGKTETELIISFRGTLPPAPTIPSFLDWMQDLLAVPIKNKHLTGKVHCGFLIAFLLLEKGILDAISKLDPESKLPIYVTGHSKGGGIAPIAGMYLKNNNGLSIENVITFAGPNPGDSEFCREYNRMFDRAIRYENYLDIVPLLPPLPEGVDVIKAIPGLPKIIIELLNEAKSWDYHAVGSLKYINSHHEIIPLNKIEADAFLPVRLKDIADEAKETGSLKFLGDAHNEDCFFGYMDGVCKGEVCLKKKKNKKMKGKKLVDNWIKTLETLEPKEIVKLYSNKGVLLGTLAEEPLVGREQIKTYFDKFVTFHPEGNVTWWYNQKLGFSKVAIDGNYTFWLDEEKARKKVEARFTFVFRRNWLRFGKWEIITHHSSERPRKAKKI